jgi:hypothetical protein
MLPVIATATPIETHFSIAVLAATLLAIGATEVAA